MQLPGQETHWYQGKSPTVNVSFIVLALSQASRFEAGFWNVNRSRQLFMFAEMPAKLCIE